MTREQIIVNVVIAVFVGLFLIVVGAVLNPLLKRMWARMNRPSPLTPQTKGQLVTNLAMYEDSLERLNYLSTDAKDLFLYLIQLVMSLCFCLLSRSAYTCSDCLCVTPQTWSCLSSSWWSSSFSQGCSVLWVSGKLAECLTKG